MKMAITLTDSAANRVRTFLIKRGNGIGLRLGVKKTGCSGFSYIVNYADDVGADDVVFDIDDVKVIVDRQSLDVIDGTEVDYVREGLNEAFKFRNPQAIGECGCGESFSIQE
jgi:iron-sulfur cluster assembly protein